MGKTDKIPILMTASVSTRGMKGACFSDAERERMYLESLRYYLETFTEDQPIVFAENSGWNLNEFAGKLNRTSQASQISHTSHTSSTRVEFVSVDPSICDLSRGKGYNEILMISEAVARSAAIRAAGAFLKVTGRYPIYNLEHFLSVANRLFKDEGAEYYADFKDHKVFDVLFPHNTKKWNGHKADTVLFAATIGFYERVLAPTYVDCNDYTDDWIENVWFKVLKPFRGQKGSKVKLRLDREMICGGLQGSTATTMAFSQSNESAKAKLARLLGNCLRRFTPWFWF